MDGEGSIAELRSRMSRFAVEHSEYMLGRTEKIDVDCNNDQSPENREFTSDLSTARINIAKIINQIQKWDCYFDGNLLSFLEKWRNSAKSTDFLEISC